MHSLVLFLWLIPVIVHVLTGLAALAQPWMRRRDLRRSTFPPVSMILPVHGPVEAGRDCLASAFAEDYPELELLICAQHATPEVLAMVSQVAAAYPDRPYRIVRGTDNFAASPKIDNIAEAYRSASHDTIVIKDDTIRLKPGQVVKVVRELTDAVGMAVAVPMIRQTGGFAGLIEQSYVNIHSGRWLLAGATFGMGFGIGKLCAFRRSDMERAGGLASIAHTIAEDNAMAKQLKAIDLPTVMTETMADQLNGYRTFRQVWDRLVRWTVCRRIEEPGALLGEFMISFTTASLGAILVALVMDWSPLWLLLLTWVVWVAVDCMVARFVRQRLSFAVIMAGLSRDCLFPFILAAGISSRRVKWGGRTHVALQETGRITGDERA